MQKLTVRGMLGLVVMAAIARLAFACSDDGTSTTSGSSGSTGSTTSSPTSPTDDASTSSAPSNDGLAACYSACDHQTEPSCAKTPASYNASCKQICDVTYTRVPSECAKARVAYDVCARDEVTVTCVNDLPRLSPSGACASEAQACMKCSPDAGIGCFSPLL